MKKIQAVVILILKSMLFSSLPYLLLLFVLYEFIFDVDPKFPWLRLSLYFLLIAVVSVTHYRRKTVDAPVEGMEELAIRIHEGNWKVMEGRRSSFELRPRFDYPYNILSGDRVHVEYSEGIAKIEGPRLYVDSFLKVLKGEKRFGEKRWVRVVTIMLVLLIFSLPILAEAGILTRLKTDIHNYRARSVEKIEIQDAEAMGNTVNNINSYGFGAAYGDHFFYVEDGLSVVRVTKDFQDKTYLIENSSGWGISRMNIVEGWIFYLSGKTLHRMRTDGTDNEAIYRMGFLSDIHVRGSWIYFINPSDEFTVYRMDVNGQNLEKIVDREVSDLAVQEDRLMYSFGDDEDGYLESSDLEGQDRRTEMGLQVIDLVRWDGFDYFIGPKDYRLYRVETGGGTPQALVDRRVSNYFVTDAGIYYTLHSPDAGYPGDGLYKMGHDGTGKLQLMDTRFVEGMSQMEEWIVFHSDDKDTQTQKRLDTRTDEITILE